MNTANPPNREKPPAPPTVSSVARQFIAIAEPFDMGRPETPEQWQALRRRVADEFDALGMMRETLKFELDERRLGPCRTLVFHPPPVDKPADDSAILHWHGGCYVVGSPEADAAITAPLCIATGSPVWSLDYALAPEQPYPAAVEEGVACYRQLLQLYPAKRITMTGSSSGASLATAVLLQAMDEGLPMPAALGLLSPWADLARVGDTYLTLDGIAPVIDYEHTLEHAAKAYAGGHGFDLPLLSPVHADYPAEFPPVLIQTGTRDLLLSNCARLHRKMRAGGVVAELSVYEGMWHSFQMMPGLPERDTALAELGDFLRFRLASAA